uniref:BTB domain-containing protein n=1 Tax=Panagrellus redivivus TaxID=6233 RepID=A0A7E4USF9_PANRE
MKESFKDVVFFTLTESDFKRKIGDAICTEDREIPYKNKPDWYVECYPSGNNKSAAGHVSILIAAPGVKCTCCVAVDGTSFKKETKAEYKKSPFGFEKFASHSSLNPFFVNGKLTISCTVDFMFSVSYMPAVPRVFQSCNHMEPDFKLVVGSNEIDVHKGFLSLISSVFYKMFTENTPEARTGRKVITEFDFDTVNAAIDYCYGRDMIDPTSLEVVGILHFATKYDIKSVIAELESIPPFSNLSLKTFCATAHYAFDSNNKPTMLECAKYLNRHLYQITTRNDFNELPPEMKNLAKDVTCLTITEEALKKNVGVRIDWPTRAIPYTADITWKVGVYPAGSEASFADHVSLAVFVHNPSRYTVRCCFELDGTSYHKAIETFQHSCWVNLDNFASHQALRPYLINGRFKLTCTFLIRTTVNYMPKVPRLFQGCKHMPTDFKLVVGSNEVDVHKSYLALISPVFHAMFSHDTTENQLEKSVITDLDFDVVDAGIDYIYGRGICSSNITMKTVVGILRFADKYDIKGVTYQLEPLCVISVETFSAIVHYAYDCSKESLLADCINFLKTHSNRINRIHKLVDLPPKTLLYLLQSAFELKTHCEVYQFAKKNGIISIIDVIEQPLITKMTLDNFCFAVTYAWECSRDKLKNACAAFLNGNRTDTMSLEEFHTLPTEAIREVLELANELRKI